MKKTLTFGILVVLMTLASASAADAAVCTDIKINLSKGYADRAPYREIASLQEFLRAEGYLRAAATGYYGAQTTAAVRAFQRAHGLEAVGNVGPMTRALIRAKSCTVPVVHTPSPHYIVYDSAHHPGMSSSLPYVADTFFDWKRSWGTVSNTANGDLKLQAVGSSTGAHAYYPDSDDWTNYKITAHVFVSNGDVTLYARRVDDNNFLGCTFSGNWVSLQERVNGTSRTLATSVVPNMPPGQYFQKSTSFAMKVKGNTVGCTAVGPFEDISYTLPSGHALTKGGIGIETWSRGAAVLELQKISVEAF